MTADKPNLIPMTALMEVNYHLDLDSYPDASTPAEAVATETALLEDGDYVFFVMGVSDEIITTVSARDAAGPSVVATTYSVLPTGGAEGMDEIEHFTLTVASRGDGTWVVRWMGEYLKPDLTWTYEHGHYYDDLTTALAAATGAVDKLVINGMSWAEAQQWKSLTDETERDEYRRRVAGPRLKELADK
jgi:hypothetical protein